MRHDPILLLGFSHFSCEQGSKAKETVQIGMDKTATVSFVVLGTVQDAGSCHVACEKRRYAALLKAPDGLRKVVSLGIIDDAARNTFLFEATPVMTTQLLDLQLEPGYKATDNPNGIFLSHAHIGPYTGSMYLSKEATNAKNIPVLTMPTNEEVSKEKWLLELIGDQ